MQNPSDIDLKNVFDYLETSEGDKELLLDLIKGHLLEKKPMSVYYSCSPIALTYLHVVAARNIALMSKSGFRIVINILDIPMLEHRAFMRLTKKWPSRSPESLVYTVKNNFHDFIEKVGGHMENVEIVRLSEMWKRFVEVKDPDLLSIWHRRISDVPLEELLRDMHPRDDLGKIVGQTLDVFFAAFLDKIIPDFVDEPATILLAGEPRERLYNRVLNLLMETEYIDVLFKPMYIFYLPQLPLFGKKGGPYLKFDDSYDTIFQYVSKSWERARLNWYKRQKETTLNGQKPYSTLLLNLYRYVFKGEFQTCFFVDGDKLVEEDIDKVLKVLSETNDNTLFTWKGELLCEALAKNFFNYFHSLQNKGTREDKMPKIIYCRSVQETLDLVKDLSNETKLTILSLCNGKKTQKEISEKSGITESTVSIYLRRFKEKGLINYEEQKPIISVDKIVVTPKSFKFFGKKPAKNVEKVEVLI